MERSFCMVSMKKVNGLLEHRRAQVVGELGEAVAIDGVALVEAAEIQPVAAEFQRQGANARESRSMRWVCAAKHLGPMQIARSRVRHQFVVRHAGPEEVTQAVCQIVIRKRLHRGTVRRWHSQSGMP